MTHHDALHLGVFVVCIRVTPMRINLEPGKLDSLLRCLHRYVEANPDRFRVREEKSAHQTILRLVLIEDCQKNEGRLLRSLQFGQSERDLD